MLDLEVLVFELLTIDRLAACTLSQTHQHFDQLVSHEPCTHVAPCEVTALEHELWDDSVKLGFLEAEALLACT